MKWKKRASQVCAMALTFALVLSVNVPTIAWGAEEGVDPVVENGDATAPEPTAPNKQEAAGSEEGTMAALQVVESVSSADNGKSFYNVLYANGADVVVEPAAGADAGLKVTVGSVAYSFATSSTSNTVNASDGLTIFAGGSEKVTANSTIAVKEGAKVGAIFAGGNKADYDGTATVIVEANAAVGSVFGGGLTSYGDKTSSAQTTASEVTIGGTAGLVYGGGMAAVGPTMSDVVTFDTETPANSTAKNYVGSSEVTINGSVGYYFGGSYSYGGVGTVSCQLNGALTDSYSAIAGTNGFRGAATMNIAEGASINGLLYMSMRGYVGDTTLNNAGTVNALVLLPDGKNVSTYGTTSVVNTGTVSRTHLDCGCEKASVGGSDISPYPATITVDGNVNVLNTTIDENGGNVATTTTADIPEGVDLVLKSGATYAGYQAMIDGTGYASLEEAIAAAGSGDTVTLVNNVQLSAEGDSLQVSGANKDITLDLNGRTIDADATIGAKVTEGAKLTVKDSAEGGKIQLSKYGFEVVGARDYTDGSKPSSSAAVASTLTLESGTITNNGGYAATVFPHGNGATLNVTGGTIENTYANGSTDGGFAVSGNGNRKVGLDEGGIVVNVSGGTIKSVQDCAIYLPGYGDVSITGGTVEGWSGIEVDSGNLSIGGDAVVRSTYEGDGTRKYKTSGDGNYNFGAALAIVSKGSQAATGYYGHMGITITGGTIESASYYAIDEYNLAHAQDDSKASTPYIDSLAIEGGTIAGKKGAVLSDNMTGFITGGTFSSDPTAYVAEGREVRQDDDTYVVQASNFVQMTIDGATTSYSDPEAFIAALTGASGKTIDVKMMADTEVDGCIPIAEGQIVTLDLNGKALTSSYGGAFIQNSGTLTIKGDGSVYTTDAAAQGRHAVTNYGTLTIENGAFGSDKSRGNAVRNFGIATIKDGTFTACDNYTNGGYAYAIANGNSAYPDATMTIENATVSGKMNGAIACDGGTLVVKDGTYSLGDGSSNNNFRLAYVSGNGIVSIEGGTFTRNVRNNYGFFGGGDSSEGTTGSVNVSGGTFDDEVNQAIRLDSGSVNISGGTFNKGIAAGSATKVAVSGGTFGAALKSDFVADGYVVKSDSDNGTYSVSEIANEDTVQVIDPDGNAKDVAATVGAALSQISSTGGTLALVNDVTEESTITIASPSGSGAHAGVTVDLNGKALTGSVKVDDGATCTITDADGTGAIVSTSADVPAVEVNGSLTIEGATVVGSGTSGVKVNPGAKLSVAGGEVKAQIQPVAYTLRSAKGAESMQYGIEATGANDKKSTVEISGGKVSGTTAALSVDENVTTKITGGAFSSAVSDYVSAGYVEREVNGSFYVTKEGAYEVSAYKENSDDATSWTYPEAGTGKVFAGWYTSASFDAPYMQATGQAYAKFVSVESIVGFKGGSLRMDADAAEKTNLRFGYSITMPEGLSFDSASWTVSGKKKDGSVVTSTVPVVNRIVSDNGEIGTNLVLVNLEPTQYSNDYSAAMTVTFKTADGTTVTAAEPVAKNRTVKQVAEFVKASATATSEEKTYADAILSAIK